MADVQGLLADLPVAALRVDPRASWRIIAANGTACRLLGHTSADELLLLSLPDLCETSAAWDRLKEGLTGNTEPLRVETILRRKTGKTVRVTVYGGTAAEGPQTLVLFDGGGPPSDTWMLQEAEERYRVLVEGAGETICTIDYDGVFRFMNSTAAARVGGRPEDFVGKTSWDVFPKEIADRHVASIRRVIETGADLATDSREFLQGKWYWYHTTVRPVRNAQGRVTMAMIIARDVTGRKEAEAALQRSEERYRTLFDSIPVAVYRTAPDGRIIDANPALYHLFGSSPENPLLLDANMSYVNPDDRQRWAERLEAEGLVRNFEVEMRRVDGSTFWARNTGQLIRDRDGRPLCFQGSLEDITERKRTEQQLRLSEEKYRQLFATATDAILLYDDAASRFIDVNESALRLFGYTRKEFLALSYADITAEPELSDHVYKTLQAGRQIHVPVRQYRKKDGTVFPVEIAATMIVLDGRKVICGVIHDITARVQAQQALEESKEKYQALAENSEDILFSLDAQGRVTYLGPQGGRYGLHPDVVVGRHFAELIYFEDRDWLTDTFERTMVSGEPGPSEFRIQDARGEIRWMEDRSTALRDDSGAIVGMMGVLRDITFRKQAEAASHEYQERLRSLAMELSLAEERVRKDLATSLHDGLVQLLSVIRMRLALLDEEVRTRAPRKRLAELKQLVDRATTSARSLMLHMSHPALYEMGLVAAAEWLAEDMEELRNLKVDLKAPRKTQQLLDQRTRVVVFQCLRELLINVAKHAATEQAKVRIAVVDGVVRVTVTDKGVGFDPSAARLRADGSGFGLFSIEERIGILGGKVEIRSAPGRGTTVVMEVPIVTEDSQTQEGGMP